MENAVTIKTSLLVLDTDKSILEPASMLRGCIGRRFLEYPTFHNHVGDRYLKSYPRIQYKIIDNKGYVLGIEEGAKLIKMISEMKELSIGNSVYNIKQKTFHDKDEVIMPTRKFFQYKFLTPWLPLDEKNYPKFKSLRDWKDRKMMLNKILVGNIITMCKGLSFDVEPNIYAHTKIKEMRSIHQDIIFTSFIGEFRTNFKIPDFFGIGNGVSHGFGTVKNEEIL